MFVNRYSAGKKLANQLSHYKGNKKCIVLGLPRGGVVVAHEVAKAIQAPLDVICPRKISAPFDPEFALGAITETGEPIFNEPFAEKSALLQERIAQQKEEAKRRLDLFRKGLPPRNLKGKIVIIVDDGIATGSTMLAAIQSAKQENPEKIVVAVPVAPPTTIEMIERHANEVICLQTPFHFMAIGQFYEDFPQVEEEEVIELLHASK